jgi:hypothetical protein
MPRVRRQPGLAAALARRLGRTLLAALTAAVLLVGTLRAGSRYFTCDLMGMVSEAPCCAACPHRTSTKQVQAEVRAADCCEQHVVGRLPAVATSDGNVSTPPAPMFAVFEPTLPMPSVIAEAHGRVLASAQTGPPRALASQRSRSMVRLT